MPQIKVYLLIRQVKRCIRIIENNVAVGAGSAFKLSGAKLNKINPPRSTPVSTIDCSNALYSWGRVYLTQWEDSLT